MNFKDYLSKLPIPGNKTEHQENYFSLYITQTNVTATIWTIHQNNLTILNSASSHFDNTEGFHSEKTHHSLIEAANFCLDEALADIMPEPSQLLFGIPEEWLHQENI